MLWTSVVAKFTTGIFSALILLGKDGKFAYSGDEFYDSKVQRVL